MTPGIASRRAELSSPLLPPHLLPPGAVSHFGSAVSVSPAFIQSNPSLHLSPCFLLALQLLSLTPISVILSFILCPRCLTFPSVSLALTRLSLFGQPLSPNLFFLTFNLLLDNYLSSMTDQQRLVSQEKAEIHLTKSLYVQQVSFTTGFPAVRGIGNPALCALSSLQSSPTWISPHVHVQYPCWRYTASHSGNISWREKNWNGFTRLVVIWFARLSHFHLAKWSNPSVLSKAFQIHVPSLTLGLTRPQAQCASFTTWTNSYKLGLIASNYCSDFCARDACLIAIVALFLMYEISGGGSNWILYLKRAINVKKNKYKCTFKIYST